VEDYITVHKFKNILSTALESTTGQLDFCNLGTSR